MDKVRPWCGQPSDRGRLRNRTCCHLQLHRRQQRRSMHRSVHRHQQVTKFALYRVICMPFHRVLSLFKCSCAQNLKFKTFNVLLSILVVLQNVMLSCKLLRLVSFLMKLKECVMLRHTN